MKTNNEGRDFNQIINYETLEIKKCNKKLIIGEKNFYIFFFKLNAEIFLWITWRKQHLFVYVQYYFILNFKRKPTEEKGKSGKKKKKCKNVVQCFYGNSNFFFSEVPNKKKYQKENVNNLRIKHTLECNKNNVRRKNKNEREEIEGEEVAVGWEI